MKTTHTHPRTLSFFRRILAGTAILAASLPSFGAPQQVVRLDVSNSHPVLVVNEKGRTFLKVSITGENSPRKDDRRAVNLALVLDRSGSMAGDKIIHAREAAKRVIDRLGDGDIVSICAYDDSVTVIAPATEINDNSRTRLRNVIDGIHTNGSTALFAGVSKGAAEIRKNLSPTRVNRIILLSDGIANVGPSSPRELGHLGMSLGSEGVSVTTIGLGQGYNEDLMTQLAYNSDGAHSAILNAGALVSAFDHELDSMFSVVAQKLTLEIKLSDGVKVIRSLGRDVEINGQKISTVLNQVGEHQEKYVLIEVEVPEQMDGEIANCVLNYENVFNGETCREVATANISRARDKALAEQSVRQDIYSEAIAQQVFEANTLAVELRDKGQVQEAKQTLLQSAAAAEDYLGFNRSKLSKDQTEKLENAIVDNKTDAVAVEDQDAYNDNRKMMRARQNMSKSQNSSMISK